MSSSEAVPAADAIRFKEVYGVFVLSPDDVQFRTGSLSGRACVVSDPERRGLLGPVIERLLVPDGIQRRPWNEAETELLEEILPQLRESGIVEADGVQPVPGAGYFPSAPILRKALTEARMAVVGHGVLGEAVRSLLTGMPCGSITMIESSSVARAGVATEFASRRPPPGSAPGTAVLERRVPQPRDSAQWVEAIGNHDWVIAAHDCFEPEELAALNQAALRLSVPWSLVCFDGYEGWVGPTFVPAQTACFGCFQRRLVAGAAETKHVFMDPRVKVHRVPSPWSAGPETGAWVSLITSMFALELIAATQGRSFTLSQMLIVHRLNLTFQRESVLRLPRCPDCSTRRDAPAVNVFSHVLSTRQKRE
jgi:bacteriocin biosynthesis cyclodehydratase domain-containing protein